MLLFLTQMERVIKPARIFLNLTALVKINLNLQKILKKLREKADCDG